MGQVRGNNMQHTVTIYINLPDEGSTTRRPTQAVDLGNGTYEVLSTGDYNPEDEVWQFLPGAIVRCEKRKDGDGEYLYAAELAE